MSHGAAVVDLADQLKQDDYFNVMKPLPTEENHSSVEISSMAGGGGGNPFNSV